MSPSNTKLTQGYSTTLVKEFDFGQQQNCTAIPTFPTSQRTFLLPPHNDCLEPFRTLFHARFWFQFVFSASLFLQKVSAKHLGELNDKTDAKTIHVRQVRFQEINLILESTSHGPPFGLNVEPLTQLHSFSLFLILTPAAIVPNTQDPINLG